MYFLCGVVATLANGEKPAAVVGRDLDGVVMAGDAVGDGEADGASRTA